MDVPRTIFRQYDVRGLVDRELTPELARALGRAYASVAWDRIGAPPARRSPPAWSAESSRPAPPP